MGPLMREGRMLLLLLLLRWGCWKACPLLWRRRRGLSFYMVWGRARVVHCR